MKKLFICFTFFYLNLLLIKAQEFSGAINFKYATVYDTTLNVYYVKNHLVRLDQFARKKNIVEGSFIFNLKSKSIIQRAISGVAFSGMYFLSIS